MVKTRRPEDYDQEASRFEEWLMLTEGKSINDVADIDELIDKMEKWLESIDIYGSAQGNFAKSLLTYLLSRSMIPSKSKTPKEIEIIRGFRVDRSGAKWLGYEERTLERLYKNPKVSTPYIARELGRSTRSLYSKARRLGVKRPKDAMTEQKANKMFAQMNK